MFWPRVTGERIYYIVTCPGFAWLIRRVFGFDDWIYWTFIQLVIIVHISLSDTLSSSADWILHGNYSDFQLNSSTTPLYSVVLLNSDLPKSKSKSHCDWRSVSQSGLVSSSIWCSWPVIYYCLTVTFLLLWGALSDERTGLYFVRVIVCSSKSFVIILISHSVLYYL
jgi:hypothetical protein